MEAFLDQIDLRRLLTERLKNMGTITNIWKVRHLSLKGKISILKTLVLPQIQFLLAMIYVPDKILQQIEKILFAFLWNGKTAKIKKPTMIAPIIEGGMGISMIDIYSVHTATKCMWLNRLLNDTDAKWKTCMWSMLNTNPEMINKN